MQSTNQGEFVTFHDAQIIDLSYSNLMRAIVSKMNLRFGDGSPFLDPKDFEQIGDLTFKQLASLRHRGAFSTVSLTFAKCCQQTQTLSLSTSEKNAMLRKWYQVCLYEQHSMARLADISLGKLGLYL